MARSKILYTSDPESEDEQPQEQAEDPIQPILERYDAECGLSDSELNYMPSYKPSEPIPKQPRKAESLTHECTKCGRIYKRQVCLAKHKCPPNMALREPKPRIPEPEPLPEPIPEPEPEPEPAQPKARARTRASAKRDKPPKPEIKPKPAPKPKPEPAPVPPKVAEPKRAKLVPKPPKPAPRPKPKKQVIVYESSSDDYSSAEEEPEIVYRKKVPYRPQHPPIIFV